MAISIKVVRKGDGSGILRRIARAIQGPKKVKVGFPAGTGDVIDRAFYNEFGTRGGASGGGWGGPVPERPFMRLAMKKGQPEFRRVTIGAAKQIIGGRSDMRKALALLGIEGQGQIQESISDLSSPPNSPVTVALKGSSKPLIDTGQMRQSVTWKIDE